MTRPKVKYVCQECGAVYPKMMGQCYHCGQWGKIAEEISQPSLPSASHFLKRGEPTALPHICEEATDRVVTGISEFDRVTGGGIVPGSLILIGGSPGIGKSTLLLSVADSVSSMDRGPVVYVTGEESLQQIKMRAARMEINSENLLILPEIDMASITDNLEKLNPSLVIIDSIQTMLNPALEAPPGSVSQVRDCSGILQRYGKTRGVPVIIVGHITRSGSIAGPMVLEHIVDTVLYFEGENVRDFRILRAQKNRFGSTREMGVFAMEAKGLVGIENPSEFFLSHHLADISGSVVVPVLEGSRILLIEIQALVTQSGFGMPVRRAEGISANRVTLMLAVLDKRARMVLGGSDVFVNVAGGVEVDEPAADLGVILSVASSLKDRPLPHRCCVFGEVGLGGEIRGVSRASERIQEAGRMGFEKIILPSANVTSQLEKGPVPLAPVDNVADAVNSIFAR